MKFLNYRISAINLTRLRCISTFPFRHKRSPFVVSGKIFPVSSMGIAMLWTNQTGLFILKLLKVQDWSRKNIIRYTIHSVVLNSKSFWTTPVPFSLLLILITWWNKRVARASSSEKEFNEKYFLLKWILFWRRILFELLIFFFNENIFLLNDIFE